MYWRSISVSMRALCAWIMASHLCVAMVVAEDKVPVVIPTQFTLEKSLEITGADGTSIKSLSTIFVKDQDVRINNPSVSILSLGSSGKAYEINLDKKKYAETPFRKDTASIFSRYPSDAVWTKEGQEDINGTACDRYNVNSAQASRIFAVFRVWVDPASRLPVQSVAVTQEDGPGKVRTIHSSMSYKPGEPDKDHFLPPPDFKEVPKAELYN